jgi:acetyltransferase
VTRLQPNARINGVTVQKMARARRGREIHVGVVTDAPFGPVLVFGAGGTMIELMDDRAMELPPLNQFLARRLIERARVAETLAEWRGAAAVDLEALEHTLLRVSEMVCELPQLREMDINPIIVDEHGAVAVDARIVIDHPAQIAGGRAGRYHHLAILPYPARYEQRWPLQGGGEYNVRPIHPDDSQMLQVLVSQLSPESRYFRFASSMAELPPSMLARFTLIDYDREMALVAQHAGAVLGVARYSADPDRLSAEYAIAVRSDWKGRGVGYLLMTRLIDVARRQGVGELVGEVLYDNRQMLAMCRELGFNLAADPDDASLVRVRKPLL